MSDSMLMFLDVVQKKTLYEDEFVDFIENSTYYYPVYRYKSIKDYLMNFLLALCHDMPITLVDADFSKTEVKDLGLEENLDVPQRLIKNSNVVAADWMYRLKQSSSSIVLFTSGTTGLPKRVFHTIDTLTRMVRTDEQYHSNRWALAYNPTHMAGLQVLFQAFYNKNFILNLFGAPIVESAEAINKEYITNISATPTFYRLLLGTGKVFDKVKRITLGGERSNNDLHLKMKIIFPNAKLNNIYASTELGSLFVSQGEAFRIANHLIDKIKISDDGELLVHTSLLSMKTQKSDWYATGDLVEIISTEPLEFIIQSRKTEMVNIGGYKVNPNEVESVIRQYDSVLNCRVYGKPNSVLGFILCAEIQLEKGKELDKRALQLFLTSNLQEYKVPRIFKIVNKIDVTRTGKITRKS
jgi:acyl-coenzyme A synthetase/AMP-(fatty) acid ligase